MLLSLATCKRPVFLSGWKRKQTVSVEMLASLTRPTGALALSLSESVFLLLP